MRISRMNIRTPIVTTEPRIDDQNQHTVENEMANQRTIFFHTLRHYIQFSPCLP